MGGEGQSTEYRVQRQRAASGRGSSLDGVRTRPAFYSLIVWQKAQALASDIIGAAEKLPRGRAADILANQLVRSAASVPANIAEGYGRYSEAAYRSYLSIARASLFETESHLDLLERRKYLTADAVEQLMRSAEEEARLITAAMKPLRSATRNAIREEGPDYEA